MSDTRALLAMDQQCVWHPYAAMPNNVTTYAVAHAEGCTLHLTDGRTLIDGMASWWSAIHGYNHPVLNNALTAQLNRMAHVMFGGLTHQPAVQLAKTLVDITPIALQKVFFSDSGSVAVEVALKMALQYWQGCHQPQKHRVLSLRGGYHGDTFAAMSVCDPVTGMHQLFSSAMPTQLFADFPQPAFDAAWEESHIRSFQMLVTQHAHELAAVIIEPIVQGAGGMRFYSPHYLKRVRELCNEHNVLLIADEIATGFGRTGKLFACEHANISPDILCIGKALTGGYLTLAATLCTEEVTRGVCNSEAHALMHGPTFMANPLACAVANASIELLLSADWQSNITRIETQLRGQLEPARQLRGVKEVRVLGAIGVIELETPVDMARIQPMFVERGIWVRPFGTLIYTLPPYTITADELTVLTSGIVNVITQYHA